MIATNQELMEKATNRSFFLNSIKILKFPFLSFSHYLSKFFKKLVIWKNIYEKKNTSVEDFDC